MAKVPFTYLGPGPASIEVADSVTPRSVRGALYFWPGYVHDISEAELEYIRTGPVGSARYQLAALSVYGQARASIVLEPETEEVGEGKRGGASGDIIEADGMGAENWMSQPIITVAEE